MTVDLNTAIAIVVGTLGLGFIGFILRWAWTHTQERITEAVAYTGKSVDDINENLKLKADASELTRVRDAQIDIFNKLDKHDSEDRNRHEQIITAVGRLEGKMDALLLRRRERQE